MTANRTQLFDKWFERTIGRTLYPYQTVLLESHGNVNAVNKSRQTGISTFMAAYGLYKALLGKNVLIVSPSDRQSKHVMDIVQKFLSSIRPLMESINIPIELKEEMKTSLQFAHGGEVRSLPNSANTVRGFTADIIILDEFAHFLAGTDSEIMEAIAPSLSRGGELWMVSTPYGERGLFHKYVTSNDSSVTKSTINWRECPDLQEENIRRLCPDPLVFAQEYDNKFLSNIETEFPWQLLMDNTDSELVYQNPLRDSMVTLGVDVGRKVDQTAIVGIKNESGKKRVVYKSVMSGAEYETQQSFIQSLMDTCQLSRVNIDESGIGNMLCEQLRKHNPHLVTGFTFTSELKEKLVINLKMLLVNKRVVLPDDPQLLQSLHAIKRQRSTGGYIRFDADRTEETGHSDTAWALMLSCLEENTSEFGFYGIKQK